MNTRVFGGCGRAALVGAILAIVIQLPAAAQQRKPYLTFGIFIGSIEEGARIFTPTRLLPKDHAEALGHDFPTTLVHHVSEFETLLILGEHVGLKLWPTLQRYPREPVREWAYPEFSSPPVEAVRAAKVIEVAPVCSRIPGLRAVAYSDRYPLSFIVFTRGLSLQARAMHRATTSGLDLTRDQFLAGLEALSQRVPKQGVWIVVMNASLPPVCRAEG